jgi:hypothetical protein
MKWTKKGLIYGPDGSSSWALHSALQPTPLLIQDFIRIFVGFRDAEGVSRVGFVDVNAAAPSEVIDISEHPALDVGLAGTFDDNGVVPAAIVKRDDQLSLFYAGYQIGHRAKFLVFSGLATSTDNGRTFRRSGRVPVCDRTNDEPFFRVIHTMMLDDGKWRAWYGAGDSFDVEGTKQYPRYNIRHAYSADGIHLDDKYDICIDTVGSEYRVGRPFVVKDAATYRMFFSSGTIEQGYQLAYAESSDGVNWLRSSEPLLTPSPSGWDSQMQAYPALITYKDQTYMFYNGNGYGHEGFGYAVLESW